MLEKIDRATAKSFYLLFFLVPLIVCPKTFELFEFPKMVLTYGLTIIIVAFWLAKSILSKKFLFKRSVLDIPLLIFLGSQLLSTLVSIDIRTSLLGYYSRFHGGLASTVSYCLLYWAYVSNMDYQKTIRSFYALLTSAFLVSVYAVLQHIGIDKNIWVQDVQNRVFSSLGQPNWLAAWIVALTPLTWSFALSNKRQVASNKTKTIKGQLKNQKHSHTTRYSLLATNSWLWIFLSTLFFLTLLYTKSRSGFLGFGISSLIFWILVFWKNKRNSTKKDIFKIFLIYNSLFLILILAIGTPWSPSISTLINKSNHSTIQPYNYQASNAPALEAGGTESGEIRKIVWQGALNIWKAYPLLGSGVETFAFSYYKFRPIEHNLVSEWDYLYNKAHNEYLNFAATTGSVGLVSYLVLIVAIIWQIKKEAGSRKQEVGKNDLIHNSLFLIPYSLLAGFVSILVTNSFGFSVVLVAFQFFLYPAMAVALATSDPEKLYNEAGRQQVARQKDNPLNINQKITLILISLATCYLLLATSKYFLADLYYANGKLQNEAGNYSKGQDKLKKALYLSPGEAIFWDELSQSSTGLAVSLSEKNDEGKAVNFAQKAIDESNQAIKLTPVNVNLKRNRAAMFIKLSMIQSDLLIQAKETLEQAVDTAPTDAKLFYNLALSYLRTGDSQKAIETLKKTIEMKPNYRNAYFALGLIYVDEGEIKLAKEQFQYILDNINPNDKEVQREFNELN